jgi:hypothetical protein
LNLTTILLHNKTGFGSISGLHEEAESQKKVTEFGSLPGGGHDDGIRGALLVRSAKINDISL